jgi:hypothetical protein
MKKAVPSTTPKKTTGTKKATPAKPEEAKAVAKAAATKPAAKPAAKAAAKAPAKKKKAPAKKAPAKKAPTCGVCGTTLTVDSKCKAKATKLKGIGMALLYCAKCVTYVKLPL